MRIHDREDFRFGLFCKRSKNLIVLKFLRDVGKVGVHDILCCYVVIAESNIRKREKKGGGNTFVLDLVNRGDLCLSICCHRLTEMKIFLQQQQQLLRQPQFSFE